MDISDVLISALEYIKKFRNQVFVIKLGGEVMLDEKILNSVVEDIILLNCVNIKPVVVHGGGSEITDAMKKFGKVPKFVEGLRVTDEETMDIVKMVLIGKISSKLVARINRYGGNAIGLSGESGKLFYAKKQKMKNNVDLGLVGDITKVNADVVIDLIEKGCIPVISPVGYGEDGTSLNINADAAASKLAVALKAGKLILITPVRGVLDSEENLIERLTPSEVRELIRKNIAKDGMIPKLEACLYALENGVKSTHIIKAKEHAVIEEVFTEKGIGTMIVGEEELRPEKLTSFYKEE